MYVSYDHNTCAHGVHLRSTRTIFIYIHIYTYTYIFIYIYRIFLCRMTITHVHTVYTCAVPAPFPSVLTAGTHSEKYPQ